MRILVVEDDEDLATLLAESFADRGHEVEMAADGPSALSVAERFRPHVAILDVGLPNMDGFELATRLRQQHASGLRLFALTGYSREEDRKRSLAAGFDAHFVKPVLPHVLMDAVEKPEGLIVRPGQSGARGAGSESA